MSGADIFCNGMHLGCSLDISKTYKMEPNYASEPPIMQNLSDEDIRAFVDTPYAVDLPNHSQFVERTVQTLAKYGKTSSCPETRDGFVKDVLENRIILKRRRTKDDILAVLK